MDRHYFTPDEANRTLPLVRRIVRDIVDEYERWKDGLARFETAVARQHPGEAESSESFALQRRVDDIAQRINGYIAELEQIGCVLKGFDDGLVDFRGRLDDRDVWFCWKLGEAEVAHWHEIDEGFRGRRPIVGQPAGDSAER